MVSYTFHGGDGEYLYSLNIPQRHHYLVKGVTGNTVGVFRDADTLADAILNLGFVAVRNPVAKEFWSQVIGRRSGNFIGGQPPDVRFDNFHQTNSRRVKEPSLFGAPGCPECVHDHWRWSALFGAQWGNGLPFIPAGSTQTVDIGVVRYPGQVGPQQEWLSLVDGEYLYTTVPQDPVFWFSPTGYMPSDVFFSHTAWFNPHPPATGIVVNIESAASSSASSNSQDGPVSVIFGDVYQPGSTSFDPFDLNTLPPLPAGYAPLNNAGYKITTTAIVSGPHIINFSAASVNDQAAFNDLRIFHAEPDAFDPDKLIWIDRTILSPDTPAPDFSAKTLSARTDELGVYVIGKLVQNIAPSTDVANLAVTCSDSSDPITAGNNLTYTVRVTNNGPQTANNVAIRNGLSPDAQFVSATASQGTCKEIDGTVYCNLNSLSVSAIATIIIVVQPTEGTGSFPTEGKTIYNGTLVRANEIDNDQSNDSATESTNVLSNPNKAPAISITSPTSGALLVGPTNITINATATDSDGTISKVEFFDNGELFGVGTPTGNNQYAITRQNASFGDHSLIAVATDNGGRHNISNAANIIVNGAANVSITSPSSGGLFAPASDITVSANATHPSGVINKVEFFANGQSLGNGVLTSGSQYSIAWNNVDEGMYSIVAVATDGSGITTTSAPVNITVDTPPTVTMSTPADGTVFPSATNISLSATAQSVRGSVVRVDFYASGVLVGSATDVGTDQFTFTWRHVPDGFFSLTAVATDNLGVSTTSPAITIGVNTASPSAGEFVWFDDALPPGALNHTDDEGWYWVDANPGAFSGIKAHQSRNFAQLDLPNNSLHQHYFEGATTTLPVNAGDKLFTYVFLDVNSMPREIMLQWKDANGWEHRAYWGQNRISLGTDGTNSRRYIGPLPKAGQWVRLEVPANLVGLEGSTLNGMAFTLDAGRATFDLAGKTTANAAPPPVTPPGDSVWIEDGLPAGSVTSAVDDVWNWVVAPVNSGQSAHQSYFRNNDVVKYRSHSFTGATPMQVNPGDVLFTYVYLGDPDPNHQPFTPDQIMLQWYDGGNWNHRAYWGENYMGQQVPNLGVQGTESQRYMGGLPTARGWYRLEIPASYVGLEGKSVSGMAFSVFRNGKNPFVTWDRSGKSSQLSSVPLPLSATSGVWRLFSNIYGYAFETNDQGSPEHSPQKKDVFYVHPNQAAGTVPMYRFRRPTNYEYFYSRCKECYDGNGWQFEGISFYVYPDATTPGTVPLYLYHDSQFHYFLTTNQSEASSLNLFPDGTAPWAYVLGDNPPAAPSNVVIGFNALTIDWQDNSTDETSFRIEGDGVDASMNEIKVVGTVGANVTHYDTGHAAGKTGSECVEYRVRAENAVGTSAYARATYGCFGDAPPDNNPPEVVIPGSSNSGTAPQVLALMASGLVPNSATTIAKVEFFANSNKLGEVTNVPYVFLWNNPTAGTYSLTATATNTSGVSSNAGPVVVDSPSSINITSPANGDLVDHDFAIFANAFDLDGNGTIVKVEYFANGNKLGEVTDAPYVFVWNNIASGNYSLTAMTTDNAGATTTSSPVSVTVDGAPTVSITSPVSSAVFNASSTVSINAVASDSDGTISKVEFFQGSIKLGEDMTAPYGFDWNNVGAGNYVLTAVATDNLARATTSSPVNVTVNALPTVSITTPAGGTVLTAPAAVTINANASDSDGTINKVEFYQGSTLLGTDTTSPYSFSWTNVSAGNYSITAKATDNLGAVSTSIPVSITVNALPSVSITSPISGTTFVAPASISINALASDDGNISKVEFFQGATLIGTVTTSPYNLWWSSVAVGNYTLTAKATDNFGATTTSSNVSITVVQPNNSGKIAFASNRDGIAQIYSMNSDGSGLLRLTNDASNDEAPKWSPNNLRIVFQSDRDNVFSGAADIDVMNADGSGQARLTSEPTTTARRCGRLTGLRSLFRARAMASTIRSM